MTEDLLVNSDSQESHSDARVLEIRRRTNRMFGLFVTAVLVVAALIAAAILLEH